MLLVKEVCIFYHLCAQLLLVSREGSKEVLDKLYSIKLFFFPTLGLSITLLDKCSCLVVLLFPVQELHGYLHIFRPDHVPDSL